MPENNDNQEKPKWISPKNIREMYANTSGNRFASINSPVAGVRTIKELPKGSAPYQLYSLATPNGHKVSICLEEMDLEYDPHFINIMAGDQFTSGFVAINPNSKIPALVDYSDEKPLRVFETGSILLYLAEKTGKFIPKNLREKTECISWLMWQMAGTGPMTGNFGHFYRYAPRHEIEAINYCVSRYGMEVQRLLSVLDQHLEGKQYIMGDMYTIADMAVYPWVTCIKYGYKAHEFLSIGSYKNVGVWVDRITKRPAVKRGLKVCSNPRNPRAPKSAL